MLTLDGRGEFRVVLRNGVHRRNPGELEALVLKHYACDRTAVEIAKAAGVPTSSAVVTMRRLLLTWKAGKNPRRGGDRRSAAYWERRGR